MFVFLLISSSFFPNYNVSSKNRSILISVDLNNIWFVSYQYALTVLCSLFFMNTECSMKHLNEKNSTKIEFLLQAEFIPFPHRYSVHFHVSIHKFIYICFLKQLPHERLFLEKSNYLICYKTVLCFFNQYKISSF